MVAGVMMILDVTAEDILRKNPRYLTRAKSFGPQLVTPDKVGEIGDLTVTTVLNCEESRREHRLQHAILTVIPRLFYSRVMMLLPRSGTN